MKKLWTTIAMAGFFVWPCVVSATYIIHLKDGRDFVTEQYLEEGDLIKFERYGGLIGIREDLVKEIEEVPDLPEEKKTSAAKLEGPAIGRKTGKKEKKEDLAAKTEASKQKRAERAEKATGKEQKKEKLAALSEEEKKNAEWEKIAKTQKLLEEKRRLMREKEAVIASYKEAKARKNMEKKKQYWNELLSLQKKLGNLRERAVAENGGGLPDWWDDAR